MELSVFPIGFAAATYSLLQVNALRNTVANQLRRLRRTTILSSDAQALRFQIRRLERID